jgi:hypothetical protein
MIGTIAYIALAIFVAGAIIYGTLMLEKDLQH